MGTNSNQHKLAKLDNNNNHNKTKNNNNNNNLAWCAFDFASSPSFPCLPPCRWVEVEVVGVVCVGGGGIGWVVGVGRVSASGG